MAPVSVYFFFDQAGIPDLHGKHHYSEKEKFSVWDIGKKSIKG